MEARIELAETLWEYENLMPVTFRSSWTGCFPARFRALCGCFIRKDKALCPTWCTLIMRADGRDGGGWGGRMAAIKKEIGALEKRLVRRLDALAVHQPEQHHEAQNDTHNSHLKLGRQRWNNVDSSDSDLSVSVAIEAAGESGDGPDTKSYKEKQKQGATTTPKGGQGRPQGSWLFRSPSPKHKSAALISRNKSAVRRRSPTKQIDVDPLAADEGDEGEFDGSKQEPDQMKQAPNMPTQSHASIHGADLVPAEMDELDDDEEYWREDEEVPDNVIPKVEFTLSHMWTHALRSHLCQAQGPEMKLWTRHTGWRDSKGVVDTLRGIAGTLAMIVLPLCFNGGFLLLPIGVPEAGFWPNYMFYFFTSPGLTLGSMFFPLTWSKCIAFFLTERKPSYLQHDNLLYFARAATSTTHVSHITHIRNITHHTLRTHITHIITHDYTCTPFSNPHHPHALSHMWSAVGIAFRSLHFHSRTSSLHFPDTPPRQVISSARATA